MKANHYDSFAERLLGGELRVQPSQRLLRAAGDDWPRRRCGRSPRPGRRVRLLASVRGTERERRDHDRLRFQSCDARIGKTAIWAPPRTCTWPTSASRSLSPMAPSTTSSRPWSCTIWRTGSAPLAELRRVLKPGGRLILPGQPPHGQRGHPTNRGLLRHPAALAGLRVRRRACGPDLLAPTTSRDDQRFPTSAGYRVSHRERTRAISRHTARTPSAAHPQRREDSVPAFIFFVLEQTKPELEPPCPFRPMRNWLRGLFPKSRHPIHKVVSSPRSPCPGSGDPDKFGAEGDTNGSAQVGRAASSPRTVALELVDHDLHNVGVVVPTVVSDRNAYVPSVDDANAPAVQSACIDPLLPYAWLVLLWHQTHLLNRPLQVTLPVLPVSVPTVCVLGARSIERDAQRIAHRLLRSQRLPSRLWLQAVGNRLELSDNLIALPR